MKRPHKSFDDGCSLASLYTLAGAPPERPPYLRPVFALLADGGKQENPAGMSKS
jgi:hypothetical protein